MNTTFDLISLNEAARRLEVHKETLLRAIRTGELEAVKLGHSYRVTDSTLKDWLRKRTVNAQEQGA